MSRAAAAGAIGIRPHGPGPRPAARGRDGPGDLPMIASGLPEGDTRRLRKCTGVARPCVVTVDGLEQGDKTKIMATHIAWQD